MQLRGGAAFRGQPVAEAKTTFPVDARLKKAGGGTTGDFAPQFVLTFVGGRGLLVMRDKTAGPFNVKLLELEIPEISFPFDVTGGADRFKNRLCLLKHLVFSLDHDNLKHHLARSAVEGTGFQRLEAAIRDGYVEFSGRFATGDQEADFTFRSAFLMRSQQEVDIVFFDTRVYGWLPVPAGLLPVYLKRALFGNRQLGGDLPGLWPIEPSSLLLRNLMPRGGWKVPDVAGASLVAADCARGRLTIAAGPDSELNAKQLAEREPPTAALRAAEGMRTFADAERALTRGDIQGAYRDFRDALDENRGGPWARYRLLQIGACDPELAIETRQLAEEVLSSDPNNAQARIALASIAGRDKSYGVATEHYNALAEFARANRNRFDTIAAELAAAQSAAPIDPGGALAAYERAAARARDSVVAHRALFTLRAAQGDWAGALKAGERLVKLEQDDQPISQLHREMGAIARSQLGDLKRARLHYDRALRLNPEDAVALEGLAETYAARGEPSRATSYLSRLAEKAEESDDRQRIVSLNMRLGEIWERWLGDAESAAARYQRVLAADPQHRGALLRLAEMSELRGDLVEARALYQDVIAAAEDRGEQEATDDMVATYTRLAQLTLMEGGSTTEAIASLERALELDAANRTAREELARLLRQQQQWDPLLALWEQACELSDSDTDLVQAHLQVASHSRARTVR